MNRLGLLTALTAGWLAIAAPAHATYWNVLNLEGENTAPAFIATYATLNDMVHDANRLGLFNPNSNLVGANIVDSGSDGHTYWNLFNPEGEHVKPAIFATYATLNDMLHDANRLDTFNPNSNLVADAIVGSGFDGHTYWNVLNLEDENVSPAFIATYATLNDMLHDANRLGLFNPNSNLVADALVGSGSDGHTYWNLFNLEGEHVAPALFATYATLNDMLHDSNRLDTFNPNSNLVADAIVGTGSDSFPTAVPEPGAWATLLLGFGVMGAGLRRVRRSLPVAA